MGAFPWIERWVDQLGRLPAALQTHKGKAYLASGAAAVLGWFGITESMMGDLQAMAYGLADSARAWGDVFGFIRDRVTGP